MLRELLQKEQSRHSEQTIKEQEKKFNELIEYARQLMEEEDALFKEVGIHPDQLSRYMADSSNFTPAEQAEIQRQIDAHEQTTSQRRCSQRDRLRLRKTYGERSQVQQHWMFVK